MSNGKGSKKSAPYAGSGFADRITKKACTTNVRKKEKRQNRNDH